MLYQASGCESRRGKQPVRRVAGSGRAEKSARLSGASKAVAESYDSKSGSKAVGPMRKRELCSLVRIENRKGGVAEPIISGRRQQTVPVIGWVQDTPGVWKRARSESLVWNRRDPIRRPTSGEGGGYKPMAKCHRAGRESEGLVVPRMRRDHNLRGGKGLYFGRARDGGKCEGMTARSNNPLKKHENSAKGCLVSPSAGGRRGTRSVLYGLGGVTARRATGDSTSPVGVQAQREDHR